MNHSNRISKRVKKKIRFKIRTRNVLADVINAVPIEQFIVNLEDWLINQTFNDQTIWTDTLIIWTVPNDR